MFVNVFYSDQHKAVSVSVVASEVPYKDGVPTRNVGATVWMSPAEARELLWGLQKALSEVPVEMVASDLGGPREPMPTPPAVEPPAPLEGQTAASAARSDGLEIL